MANEEFKREVQITAAQKSAYIDSLRWLEQRRAQDTKVRPDAKYQELIDKAWDTQFAAKKALIELAEYAEKKLELTSK
jgi:hypothetical protein